MVIRGRFEIKPNTRVRGGYSSCHLERPCPGRLTPSFTGKLRDFNEIVLWPTACNDIALEVPMKVEKLSLVVALTLTVMGISGCMVETIEGGDDPFVGLPSDDEGKADGYGEDGELSAEQRAILERMRARHTDVRELKADLSIGESHDGFLAEPPQRSPLMDQADYVTRAREIMNAENADRTAFYDLVMASHEVEIRQQTETQRGESREQGHDQICSELPGGVLCSTIADEVIDQALVEALEVAVQAALVETRVAVQEMYADYWQDRTSRDGEWIEVEIEPGVHAWIRKGF